MADPLRHGNGGVLGFLRDYWWQVGVVLLTVVGWVWRVEAAVGQMYQLERRLGPLERAHRITEALGRLECKRNLDLAQTAGLPCGILLNERWDR